MVLSPLCEECNWKTRGQTFHRRIQYYNDVQVTNKKIKNTNI